MTITVDGKELPLTEANVTIARASVNTFLETVRKSSQAGNNEALFFTVLLMMYKKSGELLNEVGVDNLRYALEQYYEGSAQV